MHLKNLFKAVIRKVFNWLAFEFLGVYSPSRLSFDKKYQERFKRRNKRWAWLEKEEE